MSGAPGLTTCFALAGNGDRGGTTLRCTMLGIVVGLPTDNDSVDTLAWTAAFVSSRGATVLAMFLSAAG
jgi:hypothetical protein